MPQNVYTASSPLFEESKMPIQVIPEAVPCSFLACLLFFDLFLFCFVCFVLLS
jgi:hypothetical protein